MSRQFDDIEIGRGRALFLTRPWGDHVTRSEILGGGQFLPDETMSLEVRLAEIK